MSASPSKTLDSGFIGSEQRISYQEQATDRDDANSDDFTLNDDDEAAVALDAREDRDSEESDCDVDEHASVRESSSEQVSPPRMNLAARVSMAVQRNLSAVLEERSF